MEPVDSNNFQKNSAASKATPTFPTFTGSPPLPTPGVPPSARPGANYSTTLRPLTSSAGPAAYDVRWRSASKRHTAPVTAAFSDSTPGAMGR